MSGQSLDVQLTVSTQKAEKDIQNFLNKAKKQLEKIEVNPTGKGKGGSGGGSTMDKVLKEEQKALESLKKQQIKYNEQTVKQQDKAQNQLMKQQQRIHQQRIRDEEKFDKTRQKMLEDSLQRYKLIEIQRGRAGIEATEHSMRVRQQLETEINKIIARSNQNNLEDTKRALALEIAIHRKHLDEKVAAEKHAAALGLAAKNHQQKQASKFNNTMFQVQQTVEDASFAGFRGASNNLALMANQLGGPGGTIALLGLMGVTMTPIIAKMAGFGDKTKEAAKEVERLTEAILNNQKAKLNADVETKGSPISTDDIKQKRAGLGQDLREFELDRRQFNKEFVENNPARDAMNMRIFREQLSAARMKAAADPEAAHGSRHARDFFDDNAMRKKMVDFGLITPNLEGPSDDLFQKVIDQLEPKQAQKERELLKRTGMNEFDKTLFETKGPHRGRLTGDALRDASKKLGEEQAKRRSELEAEKKRIEELSKNLRNVNMEAAKAVDFLEKQFDGSTFRLDEDKPNSLVEKIERQNEQLKDKFEEQKQIILDGMEKARAADKQALAEAPLDRLEDVAFKQQKNKLDREKEATENLKKMTEEYQKHVDANRELLNLVEKVKDAHEDLTKEVQKASQAHQEKIQQLQKEQELSQQSFEMNKIQTQAGINQNKIAQQGEAKIKQAHQMVDKKFAPLIKHLKLWSQSPAKTGFGTLGSLFSEKLQAVEQTKANLHKQIDEKGQQWMSKKIEAENQKMFTKQSQFLKDKASMAGQTGDFEKAQKHLEELQQIQMQAASSSKSPKTQQKHLQEAEHTQEQIIQSIKEQAKAQKDNLNTLGQMKSKLEEVANVKLNQDSLVPDQLNKVKETNAELQKMHANLEAIKNGKPLPHPDAGVPGKEKGKPVDPAIAQKPGAMGQKAQPPAMGQQPAMAQKPDDPAIAQRPPRGMEQKPAAVNKPEMDLKSTMENVNKVFGKDIQNIASRRQWLEGELKKRGLPGTNDSDFSFDKIPKHLLKGAEKLRKDSMDLMKKVKDAVPEDQFQDVSNKVHEQFDQPVDTQQINQANTNTATIHTATINKAIFQNTNGMGGGGGNTSNTTVNNSTSSSIGSVNISMNNRGPDLGALLKRIGAASRIRMG